MKKNFLLISLSIFILSMGLSGCSFTNSNDKPSTAENTNIAAAKLLKLIDDYAKKNNFSGNILMSKDNKVLLKKSYGMADYKNKISNTPQTIFKIGSLTKQFTAMAIMILEEQGKLSTEDTLSKYIPDYPNGDKIKLHNLLIHSSGIPEHTTFENINSATHHFSPTDIIALFKDKPLSFQPGSKFEYSNSDYILLGYIIEKVSGMKYEDFIKKKIFDPLHMENSGYDLNEVLKGKAIGYSQTIPIGYETEAPYFDMSFSYSAGALYSTLDDLQKWDRALYTEKLVKKATLEKIFTPYIRTNIPDYSYGYGWGISKTSSSLKMFHNGSVRGFTSSIYRDVNKKILIVMLSNSESTLRVPLPVDDILKTLN